MHPQVITMCVLTIWCHLYSLSVVKVVTYLLLGIKPLPEPMLMSSQSGLREQTSKEILKEIHLFHCRIYFDMSSAKWMPWCAMLIKIHVFPIITAWIDLTLHSTPLTHWCRDKMDAITQTKVTCAFYSMKIAVFWLNFHWNMFARVQLTIIQHWFR